MFLEYLIILPKYHKESLKRGLNDRKESWSDQLIEFKINRPDGEYRIIQLSVAFIQTPDGFMIAGILRDITDQKTTEDLIRLQRDIGIALYSTSRLDIALANLLSAVIQIDGIDCGGIYLIDQDSGELNLLVHQGLSDDFLKSVKHFKTDHPSSILVKKGKPIFLPYKQIIKTKDPVRIKEGLRAFGLIPILDDGDAIGVFNVASLKYDEIPLPSQNALQTIAAQIGSAITKIKLNDIQRKLDLTRKQFIETANHEFRTPLTSIKGYVTFLQSKNSELTSLEKEKAFDYIMRNISRLERLIADIQDISKIEDKLFKIKKEKVDFIIFLQEEMSANKLLLGDHLELTINLPNSEILIEVDQDRIRQVFSNLFDNAIKHTSPENRKISVKVNHSSALHMFQIEITDNGVGIDPRFSDTLFDQFTSFEMKYSTRGTGIGLYLSRIIVESHGGTIEASSKGLDQGSTFTVKIPSMS